MTAESGQPYPWLPRSPDSRLSLKYETTIVITLSYFFPVCLPSTEEALACLKASQERFPSSILTSLTVEVQGSSVLIIYRHPNPESGYDPHFILIFLPPPFGLHFAFPFKSGAALVLCHVKKSKQKQVVLRAEKQRNCLVSDYLEILEPINYKFYPVKPGSYFTSNAIQMLMSHGCFHKSWGQSSQEV